MCCIILSLNKMVTSTNKLFNGHVFVQCLKSKSVTNLAEATADPVLELDARGNPMGAIAIDPDTRVVYDGFDQDDGAVDSPPPPIASEAEQNDESQPLDQ